MTETKLAISNAITAVENLESALDNAEMMTEVVYEQLTACVENLNSIERYIDYFHKD